MLSLRSGWVLTVLVVLVACGSSKEESSSTGSGGSAGGNDESVGGNGGGTPLGTTTKTSGMGGIPQSGGTGGAAGTIVAVSGGVQNGGPPCKPIYRGSLGDRTDVEEVVNLNQMMEDGMVINQHGVFWSLSDEVQTAPAAGGTPRTVVTGQYTVVGTVGSDLLLSNRNAGTTVPTVFSRVATTSGPATPTQILTLASSESLLTFDDQFLYLYDTASTSIVSASLANGTKSTVESGATYQTHKATAYGDYLYYEKDMYVVRVPKTGGASENFYYDFDLWSFDIAQDMLLVGAFSRISVAPLSNPTSMIAVASVPSGMLTSYIDWMTVANGRVFYQDSNDGFGWVNFEGTQCEGLFAEDRFFGTIRVFDGYVYVQDQTTIRRLKLPQ